MTKAPPTKALVELLEEMRELMELKGENPFKVRAFEKAATTLEGLEDEDWLKRAKTATLTEIPGIGKGIAQVLSEFLLEGKSTARDELEKSLPEGLRELTTVPGLGPKKAMVLIEELGIKSLGELEYACKENRLLNLKGFGPKVQQKILEGVQFASQSRGSQRIDEAFPAAEAILPVLIEVADARDGLRVSETGALRRRLETLTELEFLIETKGDANVTAVLERKLTERVEAARGALGKSALPVKLYFAGTADFGTELARTTGTEAHWRALGLTHDALPAAPTEEAFYDQLGLPWIPPEMRETGREVELARAGKIGDVIAWDGVQGVFHNHTTRSDGTASVEQMVRAAKERGYKYIGISDHSKSAVYARGLREPDLLEQEKEIREAQERHPDIRVFWGIESDILADGGLDYDAAVLKKFDFVIGSIHSRFQMDRETMTNRLLEAVRNPSLTMLGHVTGRILLGRKGYDVDLDRVIEECAKRGVAMEINAHPARLDIDWRWGDRLREKECLVSINPDAHEEAGLDLTKYGIAVARKALLPTSAIVNSRSASEVESWLRERR